VTAGNGAQSIVVDPTGSYAMWPTTTTTASARYRNSRSVPAASSPHEPCHRTGRRRAASHRRRSERPVCVCREQCRRHRIGIHHWNERRALAHVPATVVTGNSPLSISIDPTGRFAYVVNESDATISQFLIGSGGVLTAASPSVVTPSACRRALPSIPRALRLCRRRRPGQHRAIRHWRERAAVRFEPRQRRCG